MFEASFNAALDRYKALLAQMRTSTPEVPDVNLDTGGSTSPGVYFMNDNVRAKLLEKLAEQNFAGVTPGLRADLLHFYSDPNAPYATKRNAKQWNKLQIDLKRLKDFAPTASAGETRRAVNPRPTFVCRDESSTRDGFFLECIIRSRSRFRMLDIGLSPAPALHDSFGFDSATPKPLLAIQRKDMTRQILSLHPEDRSHFPSNLDPQGCCE
jgi:hypothetical protein